MTPQLFKAVLLASGYSVKQLSQQAGVSTGTVYRAIKRLPLSIESMEALAYALRKNVNDIIWGRRPGATTKPNGPTGPQRKQQTPVTQKECNDCHLEYPVHLGICPVCK